MSKISSDGGDFPRIIEIAMLHLQTFNSNVTVISVHFGSPIPVFLVFQNIVVLETSQERKATLCQRASKSVF